MEALLGMGVMLWIFISIFLILLPVIALWKVFEKAGRPGFAAIIPIYNIYTLLKIAQRPGWWLILFLIPYVNIIIIIITFYSIALRFGRDIIFTLGMVILPFIFLMILAFGSAQYRTLDEEI